MSKTTTVTTKIRKKEEKEREIEKGRQGEKERERKEREKKIVSFYSDVVYLGLKGFWKRTSDYPFCDCSAGGSRKSVI